MSYENAPATEMLATHCAVCGRPLLDAESVERGIGPDCAKKYGFAAAQQPADWARVAEIAIDGAWPTEPRDWANALVHRIALGQRGPEVPRYIACLDALGFQVLARKIAERCSNLVTVEAEGDRLVVKAPYSVEFNDAARRVPGARWDRERKARIVPASSRVQLWEAIKIAFGPGTMVAGRRLAIV